MQHWLHTAPFISSFKRMVFMKYLLSILFFFGVSVLYAQQRNIITELQTRKAGEGVITIHQDPQIANLVGTVQLSSVSASDARTIKTRGYRVQVYAGNNSRQARSEANRVANKVKEQFPDMPIYTYFQPPRWLCRVGDFKSVEEAHSAMRKLRATGDFKEVTIVREQINLPIE